MMFARSRLLMLAVALGAVSALPAGGGPAVAAPQSAQAGQMAQAGQPAGNGHGYGRFTHPLAVDNRMFPLTVGTQFTYHGKIVENGEAKPHSVVFTVSDLFKTVGGVRVAVAWDRDFLEGQLQEQELAFFAQDDQGNVWNLGEYPEEYENGKFTGAPNTWIPGSEGAKAGIAMQAVPEVGTPSYLQGYAPKIKFEDRAQVSKAHQKTCVRAGCYQDALVIDEWNPNEQPKDGHQLKYHAPGVGVVRVEAQGGEEQENLELVQVRHLSTQDMAKARDRVLELDKR